MTKKNYVGKEIKPELTPVEREQAFIAEFEELKVKYNVIAEISHSLNVKAK